MNVVPNELCIGFDIRVTPTTNMDTFQNMINTWMEEVKFRLTNEINLVSMVQLFQAGGDIKAEYVQKFTDQTLTSVAENDPWFKAFKVATDKHNLEIAPRIFPAGTDSRYLREVGIPAFGFSPMNHTPILLHDHNEFLNEKIFLRGIEIFKDVITEIANV